ncbi:MAG: putative metallopeptidase, partial [bacterium]
MPQQEKIYEKVPDAQELIENLCKEYPNELWAVRPNTVTVLGISNKERSKSNHKLATCRPINGAEKALMQINNIATRYIIELYFSDWNNWSRSQKLAILFHELLHIDNELGKTVRHDVQDFKIMVDKLGV